MNNHKPKPSVLDRLIEGVIQDICELPDRTSPEDQPEMMLVTGEELDGLIRNRVEGLQYSLEQVVAEAPRPMETAPRDGTIVKLLVDYRDGGAPLEDAEEAWTIGANNFGNDGEDVWRFAGWSWSQDYWCEGQGKPIGWLPFIGGSDDQRAQRAELIHRFYIREIGRLMHQAEHWAANEKPLAVHHRLQTAQAYFQVAVLFDPARRALGYPEPFADIERRLAMPEVYPPGKWPASKELHRYSDVHFVVAELARLSGHGS